MRYLTRPAILLIFLQLLGSCEYKPSGDYYRDLHPTPPGSVSIAIQNQGDTIIARENMYFYTEVQCGDRNVIFYRLYMDGVKVEEVRVGSRTFTFNPFTYISPVGIHDMGLEVGVTTGSGSIAAGMEAEAYLYRRDFILADLRQQGGYIPELKYDRSGKALKIFLDIPSGISHISRTVFSREIPGSSTTENIAVVGGTSHYETVDPAYVGQYARYGAQTYVSDPVGSLYVPFAYGDAVVQSDLPAGKAGVSPRGWPLLTWGRTHYENSCGGYRIYDYPYSSRPVTLLATVTNLSDTVYEVTGAPFPGTYRYLVVPCPKQLPAWFTDAVATAYFSTDIHGMPGLPSFYYDRLLTPEGDYFYYTINSNEINEYSLQSGTVTLVIRTAAGWFYTFNVSANRKYVLAATGISDFSYLLADLGTQQSKLVPSSQVIGSGAETGPVSVADNGLASVTTGNRIVVYDFVNNAAVAQQTFASAAERSCISPDGQYVLVQSGLLYLYRIQQGTLQLKWSSQGSGGTPGFFAFDPSLPYMACMYSDHTFSYLNCQTAATAGSFVLGVDAICNIDFANGRILGMNAGDFRVYDRNTGQQQFVNPTTQTISEYDLRIKKNSLYYSQGKRLIIF